MIRHAPSIGIGLGLSLRGSAPSFAGLLDSYPGAIGYSPLALSSDRVTDLPTIYAQRDSDEALLAFTQQEIIGGDIEAWSQGGDVYVYTYYEQGGTGNNLTQATRSAQHKIVEGGVLVKQNGSAAAYSTGSSTYAFDSDVVLSADFSIFSTVEYGVGGNGALLGSSSGNNPRVRLIGTSSDWEWLNGSGEVNFAFNGLQKSRNRTANIRSGSTINYAIQGGALGQPKTLAGTFTFDTAFSRNSAIDSIDGKIQALIIYDSDQTANYEGIDAKLVAMLTKPREVFIMLGQSNMVGRAVDGTNLTTRDNDANINEYRHLGGVDEFYGRYADYYPNGALTGFGPNVGMSRQLFADGREDVTVIRYAIGGTSVASFLDEPRRLLDPQTDLPPGDTDQWASMVAYVDGRINNITGDAGIPINLKFIWYQGAEDANYTGSEGGYTQDLAGMYETHLTRLIEDLRANITGATSSTPWVIIRSPDWNNNGMGGGVKNGQTEVRAAQVAIADADSNAQWLTSDINQSVTTTWEDASHIDAASQERLGIDLAGVI